MIGRVNVIEDAATSHLDLRQAQVDGNSFGDVKKSAVGTERERETIQTLQDVRSLVLVEQFYVNTGRYRIRMLMLVQLHLMMCVLMVMLIVLMILMGSRTTIAFVGLV